MSLLRSLLFATTCLLLFPSLPEAGAQEASRTWTSTDGKALEGTLEGVSEDGKIRLRTERGMFDVPLARFSEADQAYVAEWQANAPLEMAPWPEKVEVEYEIEDLSAGDKFLYRSPHFEFHAPAKLGNQVVRDFARVFEATYEGVKALPVGFNPILPKEGHFQTTLFASSNDYYAAGGMQGSGGMFRWRSRGREFVSGEIMVPLTSLGVKQVGSGRFIVDSDKDDGTLIHEITHQVAVMWGIYGAPVWFSEGLAEYMQSAPYRKGTMRFTNMPGNVEKMVMARSSESKFNMIPVESLMTMTRESWAGALASGGAGKNYNSANALMTYFLHMDGPANGEPVALYLRELKAGTDPREAMAKHLLGDRGFDQLQEEVKEGWRQNGMRIEF